MARGDQLLRQWNLLRTLQTRGEGVALRELADQLGVVERTIQRDLELLQELGFPVSFDVDEIGRRFWRMPPDFFRNTPLSFSVTEAISLHLAGHFFRPLTGTLFADGLNRILGKIRSILPSAALEHFAGLEEAIHVRSLGAVNYADQSETLQCLFEAARNLTSVQITYRSLWRKTTYETSLDPYGIVIYEDDLYVLGFSHRAAALRVFKVARIQAAFTTTAQFQRPEGLSLESAFRDSFGIMKVDGEPVEIVVRFEGAIAQLVEEREWHPSQRNQWLSREDSLFEIDAADSNELIATFRLTSVVEFKRWILSFGDKAEVLRPSHLRNEIREELSAAAARYGTPDSTV